MIPYGAKRLAIRNGNPRASGDDPYEMLARIKNGA